MESLSLLSPFLEEELEEEEEPQIKRCHRPTSTFLPLASTLAGYMTQKSEVAAAASASESQHRENNVLLQIMYVCREVQYTGIKISLTTNFFTTHE